MHVRKVKQKKDQKQKVAAAAAAALPASEQEEPSEGARKEWRTSEGSIRDPKKHLHTPQSSAPQNGHHSATVAAPTAVVTTTEAVAATRRAAGCDMSAATAQLQTFGGQA